MTRQSVGDSAPSSSHHAASSSRSSRKPKGRGKDKTCMQYKGFRYTKGWSSMKKITLLCSVYRKTACKARLDVYPAGGKVVINEHTCAPAPHENSETFDVTRKMKEIVDTLSIQDLAKPVHDIWKAVSERYYPNDEISRTGLSEEQVTSRVYRTRRKHYGSHLLGMVEVPPLSMVEGKKLSFFQFHVSRPRPDPTDKPQRIVGWAHPELRQLLLYHNVTIFVDGTFRCVPRAFKQCVIVMVHDRASELYVPVYFVLCTGKTEDMYFDILELIYRDTGEKLSPSGIICDFEKQLIKACQKQFENALIIGCLFHWKQAIRRRMKQILHIAEEEIEIAMTRGVLDMLTIVDPELVPAKGIKWVKKQIRARCSAKGIEYSHIKWRAFWGYFRGTWLELYDIEEWNVHGFERDLVARTNNPLERFHRELNSAFSPHPNLVTFVATIRRISQDYVAKLSNVAAGRRKKGAATNSKKRKSKKKGKKKCKGSNDQAPSVPVDESGLPLQIDLLHVEGLAESESEDEAVVAEEADESSSSDSSSYGSSSGDSNSESHGDSDRGTDNSGDEGEDDEPDLSLDYEGEGRYEGNHYATLIGTV